MTNSTELITSSSLCIICLEELDDDIMEACDTCNINCHIKCLYNWYLKNNIELCPICLKHTNNNTSITNELFESNNNDNDNNNNNNQMETLEINTDNIEEIFDNREIINNSKEIKKTMILTFCIFLLIIMALVFITL